MIAASMTVMQHTPDIPPEAIHAVILAAKYFLAGCIVLAVGSPVVRLLLRRLERAPALQIPADHTARMERIEQAVDAIAIEVERIAENQRFTTKLMAEQHPQLPHSQS